MSSRTLPSIWSNNAYIDVLPSILEYSFIHTPTWGATKTISDIDTQLEFQSTHPRGVRPGDTCLLPLRSVSIHAPTWGATSWAVGLGRGVLFQSTHPHGVRHEIALILLGNQRFNPRTHMGCDRPFCRDAAPDVVSIHAPTWGATSMTITKDQMFSFQSTHPRGVRPKSVEIGRFWYMFQSTHPRGVRRLRSAPCRLHPCFNPRTHVGCDRALRTQ